MAINDGGPAYPNQIKPAGPDNPNVFSHVMHGGFSKLEAYALAAMQGMLGPMVWLTKKEDGYWQGKMIPGDLLAKFAFDFAASMLAEHERRKGGQP